MRIIVRNVPMQIIAEVEIEIPSTTPDDKMHDLLADRLRAGKYKRLNEGEHSVETDLLDTGYELHYERAYGDRDDDEEHEGRCDAIAARREDHQRDE